MSAPVGRPTKYTPEKNKQVTKLAWLGATAVEMADFFEVRESTIYEWIKNEPEFSKALKIGREESDANVWPR